MNRKIAAALLTITLTLGCGGVAEAAEKNATIRLVCVWDYIINTKDLSRTEISGENLISVTELGGGKISFFVDGLGSEFNGNISSEKIDGKTSYTLGTDTTPKYIETYAINRFTGVVVRFFKIEGADDSLLQYGKCHPAVKKF